MNKILLIIRREYVTRVKKRIFLITTILAPLSIGVVTLLPVYLASHGTQDEKIAIYDESGIFSAQLESRDHLTFGHINTANVPYDSLKKNYDAAGFSGILHIPSYFTIEKPADIEYFSSGQLGLMTKAAMEDQLNEIMRRGRLKAAHIAPEVMEGLNVPVNLVQANHSMSTAETSTVLGYVMGFMIYIVMITYGMMVMRGVMEEKNNRIAEVITSSVKPFQLMMGKIIGIALVGLTQFIIWIVLSGVIISVLKSLYGGGISDQPLQGMDTQYQQQGLSQMGSFITDLDKLPLLLIAAGFVFFFLGGYLLYASIFAAIGAASGEEGDQSLTFIATVPIIISIILMMSVLNQPNSRLAVISSLIPFCSPIIMVGRLPFGPPVWQIILSAVLLIAGFIFMVWMAGKIYRTGILMYGKKVTLREMMKWVRY
ncbi:MAG: ABC transporter permease [Chitinophagales bacterium]|nr:ABC transporter permease [Chitinophagales bacterium]